MKKLDPFRRLIFLSHTGPDIGIDHLGPPNGLQRFLGQRDAFPGQLPGPLPDLLLRFKAPGTGHHQLEGKTAGRFDPGMGDIISVAQPGDLQALQIFEPLPDGKEVAQDLGRMIKIA